MKYFGKFVSSTIFLENWIVKNKTDNNRILTLSSQSKIMGKGVERSLSFTVKFININIIN